MRYLISSLAILLGATFAAADDAPQSNSAKEPELRLELLRRVKVDQDARMALVAWKKERGYVDAVDVAALSPELKAEYDKLSTALTQADRANTERLSAIVEQHGWPTNSLVGADGANAAWLLVQHADKDTKFQRKCLDLMVKLPKDEVSQRDLAYLTDRVLLHEGKKQLYGTQMTIADGKWEPQPLEDPAHVEQRRAEAGLEPLAEYIKLMESFYGSPGKK
jgi:hypothetical protein